MATNRTNSNSRGIPVTRSAPAMPNYGLHRTWLSRIEGRIFNLDFGKGFEILDLTMEGGYSILSRIRI
jgi:hypothetical protein